MKCRHLQTNLTPEKREKETVAWNFLAREWKNSVLAPGRGGRAAEGGRRKAETEEVEKRSPMLRPVPARLWARCGWPYWPCLNSNPEHPSGAIWEGLGKSQAGPSRRSCLGLPSRPVGRTPPPHTHTHPYLTPTWQKLREESSAESGERLQFRTDDDATDYKPWSRPWSPLPLLSLSILPLPVPAIPRRGPSHHNSANS